MCPEWADGTDGVGAPDGRAGVVVALPATLPCGEVTLTLLLTPLLRPLLLLLLLLLLPLPVLFDIELPLLLLLLLQLLLLLLLLLLPLPLLLFTILLFINPLGSGECLPVLLCSDAEVIRWLEVPELVLLLFGVV